MYPDPLDVILPTRDCISAVSWAFSPPPPVNVRFGVVSYPTPGSVIVNDPTLPSCSFNVTSITAGFVGVPSIDNVGLFL